MRFRLTWLVLSLVLVGCGSESVTTTDGAAPVTGGGHDGAVETGPGPDAEIDTASAPDVGRDIAVTGSDERPTAGTDSANEVASGPICQGQPLPVGPYDPYGVCPDSDPQKAWTSVCLTCDGLRARPDCLQMCSFYSQCYRCGARGWSFEYFGCPRNCGDGGIVPSPVDVAMSGG